MARRHGINVVSIPAGYFTERERRFDGSFLFQLAGPPALQGIIAVSNVLALELGAEYVRAFFRQRDLPLVSIGKLEGFPYIEVDNKTGFRQVIEHLIRDHGRRRIAFISGSAANPEAIQRRDVYEETLRAHGLAISEKLMLPGDFLEASGLKAVRMLFDERGVRQDEIDAIVASNDLMASGAVRELSARGLKVPRDIAIVGFDDETNARNNNPPLTTVAQPIEAVGEHAMELLIDVLEGRPTRDLELVRTVPVFRRSCGCSMQFRGDASARGRTDPEPFDSVIQRARAGCIERLEQFAGGAVDHQTVDRLFDVLTSDDAPSYETALEVVEEGVSATTSLGMDPLRWHDVLVPLGEALKRSGSLEAARRSTYRERLVEVSSLITEVAARTQSAERVRATEFTSGLHTLGSALTNGRGTQAIGALLRAALPGFGVYFHAVCLFTDSSRTKVRTIAYHHNPLQRPGVIIHHSGDLWRAAEQLAFAHLQADVEGRVFACRELLPPGEPARVEQHELLIQPLVFAEDALGYVVFDAIDNVDRLWLLEALAGHLSSALYAAMQAEQLQKARELAERASAAKSEFVAVMSHEIRTPLNAVLGHVDLCLRTNLSAEQRRYLEQVNVSAQTLLAIVNDILDLSRIDAHKLELENVRFALDDAIDSVIAEQGLPAARKGIELVIDIHPDVPDVLIGDPHRLSQVLTNLVGNAVKFSERGEVVLVVCRDRASSTDRAVLRFSVQDEGIGMDERQLQNLFQPFTQGDSSATRRYGGTGLGLAISKRLVEMMNGDIWGKSTLGLGSTFTFTTVFDGPGEHVSRMGDATGLHLLVVEDSGAHARALRTLLESCNCEVSVAVTAEQALAILRERHAASLPVHAILLDHTLPDMDGLQFAKATARDETVSSAPIILLGPANARSLFEYDLRHYGVVGVLAKPAPRSLLLQMIRSAASSRIERAAPASDRACSSCVAWSDRDSEPTGVGRGLPENGILKEILGQLQTMLDCHDTAAIDCIDLIRAKAGEFAVLDPVRKLEASVRAYDFEQARHHLSTLRLLIDQRYGARGSDA